MKESTKQSLNQDLENLEKKISKIALSDPEKHAEFSSRLTELQKGFMGLSDLELDRRKAELIGAISILDDDFSSYMDGYDYKTGTSLIWDSKLESGKAKLRTYRFNLYADIFKDLKKLDYIKLEQITKLKSQWDIDKSSSEYQYSPVEISSMEQKLSDIFLEYQLKALKTKGVFPAEKITNFVSLDEYQASLQRKLSASLENPEVSSLDKLELDTLATKSDLKTILKSPLTWETLAGKRHMLSQGEIRELLDESREKQENSRDGKENQDKNNQSTELVPVSKPKKQSKDMICVVRVPNKFFNRGKYHYKEIKVKVADNDDIKVPFKYEDSVVSVIVPEGITTIPKDAFERCTSLTEAILPSTLKHIGEGAFQNLSNLRRVRLPEGLKTIGDYAFWNCYYLEQVNFPNSLREIGHYSYINCSKLKKVKLPNRLQKLGEGAFEGCIELEEFDCSDNLETIPASLLKGCKKLSKIKFSKNLISIGRSAFEECRKLTSLTNLPNTLERIEDGAFHRCERLGIIDLPESLRHLGNGALSYITDLVHLKLPGVMSYLGQAALTANPNLKEVIMPHTLEDARDILYNTDASKLNIVIPENPKGSFYSKLGISSRATISGNDYKKRYHDYFENISKNKSVEQTQLHSQDDQDDPSL